MYHSTEVANKFIDLSMDKSPLTHMHLQKLVYMCHGWSLAKLNKPMTYDRIQAWKFGPVYPDLWEALKQYGVQPIRQKLTKSDKDEFSLSMEPAEGNFHVEEIEFINKVFDNYGQLEAFQLSALTHKVETPWYKVYHEQNTWNRPIPDDLIKEYYLDILNNVRGRLSVNEQS